jgi:hypothetical protein
MVSAQPGRDCRLVERARGARYGEPLGQLGQVTKSTVQLGTDSPGSPRFGSHPFALEERGAVSDVLRMEAVQLSHPFTVVISVEGDDPPAHRSDVRPIA